MIEGILMLLGGALTGATLPGPSGVAEDALVKAWNRFWSAAHGHALTDEELVHLDRLQEQGFPPPGWRWGRTVFLAPGEIESSEIDGAIYRVFNPEIVWIEAEDTDRHLSAFLGSHLRFSRSEDQVFGHPLREFQIIGCSNPGHHRHKSEYRIVRMNLPIHPQDMRNLRDSGLPLPRGEMFTIAPMNSWDRTSSIHAALQDGWFLAISLSQPNHPLILEPPPSFSDAAERKQSPAWERMHRARKDEARIGRLLDVPQDER